MHRLLSTVHVLNTVSISNLEHIISYNIYNNMSFNITMI